MGDFIVQYDYSSIFWVVAPKSDLRYRGCFFIGLVFFTMVVTIRIGVHGMLHESLCVTSATKTVHGRSEDAQGYCPSFLCI